MSAIRALTARQVARVQVPGARISPAFTIRQPSRGMASEKGPTPGRSPDDLGGPGGSEPITANKLFQRRRNQTLAAVAVAAVAMIWLASRRGPNKDVINPQGDASAGLSTPGDLKASRK